MYAIVEVGGRQWRVEPGTTLAVNRLAGAVGSEHTVERVLFAYDGKQPQIGRPFVSGAKVVCEVVNHHLGPKEISYHFRRRENWRKTVGHRQPLTQLIVKSILCGGTMVEAPAKAAKPAKAQPKPAAAHAKSPAKASAVKQKTKTLSTSKPRKGT